MIAIVDSSLIGVRSSPEQMIALLVDRDVYNLFHFFQKQCNGGSVESASNNAGLIDH
jgi:hypothetical protein